LTFHFSICSRVGASALIGVAVLWTASPNGYARDGSKEWIVLKDCRLIPNPANDGDSFHVSVGPNEYLFRLYFVDAPETDEMTPRRLVDQAKYFATTVPQAIEVGRTAKEFTRQKLSEPFTVFTHMSDAMGQSRLERFYAFVQTSEGDLGEQLVRNGLARNYGFKTVPPGLSASRMDIEFSVSIVSCSRSSGAVQRISATVSMHLANAHCGEGSSGPALPGVATTGARSAP